MCGETGENPVRARRREVPKIVQAQSYPRLVYLPRCHNLGNAIGET